MFGPTYKGNIMKFSELITSEMVKKAAKKCAKVAYDELVYPAAQKYVKSTENNYDDMALTFLNDFADKFFGEE